MQTFHLYKIENNYLYVLQALDNKNDMDILAIRADFPHTVFPMYSPTFKKYEDLGIPSVTTLKEINPYFLSCIQTAHLICGHLHGGLGNRVKEYAKDYIVRLHSSNNSPFETIELLAMSINRSQILNMEGLKNYVEDRQSDSRIRTVNQNN